jgi:hypothetical protein
MSTQETLTSSTTSSTLNSGMYCRAAIAHFQSFNQIPILGYLVERLSFGKRKAGVQTRRRYAFCGWLTTQCHFAVGTIIIQTRSRRVALASTSAQLENCRQSYAQSLIL